jgi:hypothetical protein
MPLKLVKHEVMEARGFGRGLTRDFFSQFTTKNISVVKHLCGEHFLSGGAPGQQTLL